MPRSQGDQELRDWKFRAKYREFEQLMGPAYGHLVAYAQLSAKAHLMNEPEDSDLARRWDDLWFAATASYPATHDEFVERVGALLQLLDACYSTHDADSLAQLVGVN